MELTLQQEKNIRIFFENVIDYLCQFEDLSEFFYEDRAYEYWNYIKWNGSGDEHFCGTSGNVSLVNGATRLALIPDDYPFIAKIGFDRGYDDEEYAYNYNEEEVFRYNYILDNYPDVIDAVPFTTKMVVKGIPMIIQEKIDVDQQEVYESYPDLVEDNSEDMIWELLATVYGNEVYNAFEECGVNDIHDGNIGLKDGKLVLFDFAGYNN